MKIDLNENYLERLFQDPFKSKGLIKDFIKNQEQKINNLQENQLKYKSLFENSPISLWEEDLSEIKKYIDIHCKDQSNIESYFDENPTIIPHLVSLTKIVDVNLATLKLYKANSKEELLKNLTQIFTEDSYFTFKQLLISIYKKVYSFETETVNKNLNNEIIHIKIKYEVVPEFENNLDRIIISIIDITTEKAEKEQLIKNELLLNEAQNIAHFGNWNYNYETNLFDRSPEIFNIFEIEKNELPKNFDTFLKFIHPEDIDQYKTVYNEALTLQQPYEHIFRIITPKGIVKYVREKGYTVFNENNKPAKTLGTVQDISQDILNEKSIKESQEQYQTLFENAPIALFEENFSEVVKKLIELGANDSNISEILKDEELFNQCLNLIFVNNVNYEALKLFEAIDKNHFHKNLPRLFTKHSLEVVKNIFIEITKGKSSGSYETNLRTVSGEKFEALIRFNILKFKKNAGKLLFSVENITIRKKLLKEIEEKQESLNQAQQIALIGSFSLYHKDNRIERTDEFYRIFEATPEELPTREECFLNFVHEEDRIDLIKKFHNSIRLKTPYEIDYRITTGKENLKYIHEKGNTSYDSNGNPIKTVGTLQDVTSKTIFQKELNKSREVLERTLFNMTDGFVSLDKNWIYTHVNFKAAELLGKKVEDLIGKHIWTEFPEGIHQPFYKNYHKAFETQQPIIFEDFYVPWNRWFENRIIPSTEGISIFFQDITERKNATQKLEEAYAIINHSKSVAISWYNRDGFPIKFISENCESLFGYLSSELMTGTFQYDQLIYSEDKERVLKEAAYHSSIETTDDYWHDPYRIICKDGSLKWVKDRSEIQRDEKGNIIQTQGFIEDINIQYIAELELEKTHEILENTLNTITEGFVTFNENFIYTYANSQAAIYLNKPLDQLIGKNLFEIFPENNTSKFYDLCKQVIKTQQHISFEEYYTDTNRWFINRVFPNQDGISIFFKDITVEKIASKKLEQAFTIINNSKTLLYTIKNGLDLNFEFISDNAQTVIGYTPHEIYANNIKFTDIIHPDDVKIVTTSIVKHIKSKNRNSYFQPHFRIITKSGEVKWIKDRVDFNLNENGKIVSFNGIFEDYTEQYLTQSKLKESHQILENTLSTITEGFFTLNSDWVYTYINPQAALLLEYKPDELLGKNIWEIDPEIVGSPFYINCKLAFDSQNPIIYDEYYKPYNKWFENRIYPSKEGLSIFFQDITEKKNVEDKIKEASNVINNSNSIAIVWENIPTWPIKYISENVQRILGYSVNEMLTEIIDFSTIMHPEDFDISNKEAFEYLNDYSTNFYTLSPYRVYSKDGKIRWISERTTVKRDKNGKALELHGFLDDITEQFILENAINSILSSVSTVTGQEYLKEIVLQLGSVLNADYTFIGLIDNENPLFIKTLYNCYQGQIIDNFSYNLAGTPCQNVINLNACSYPSNVAHLFPEDYLLTEMGIEGYVGVPLIDNKKNIIGILVGLFKNTIENTHFTESIIQLFSTRTGAEIERLKTETKLLQAEKVFAQKLLQVNKAIDAAKDVVFMTDIKGVFTYINPSFTKLYGYNSNELIGKSTPNILKSGLLSNDDYANLWKSLFEKKPINLELINKNKNGDLIDVESTLSTVVNEDNEILGFVAIQRDISDKKVQKILLEQSEKKYRDLFEKTKNATLLIKDGRFIDCNEASLQLLEFTGNKKDFLNIHPAKISPLKQPDGRFSQEKADELMAFAIEKGSHQFEWVHLKQNGKEFYAEVTLTNIEILNDQFIHCVWQDITDKKKADLTKDVVLTIAKQISQVDSIKSFSAIIKKELNVLLDTSNFYIAIFNKEKNTIKIPASINDEMQDEFNYENEFNAEGTLTGYVISTKKPLLATAPIFNKLEKLNKVQLVGAPSKIWLGVPLFNKKEVIGAIAVQSYTDVNAYTETDQKTLEIVSEQIAIALDRIQSQNKIQENELKFRTIFELSPDMVNSVSADGILLDCNQQFIHALGYEHKSELVGQAFIKLFAPIDIKNAKEKFANVLESGFTQNQEHIFLKKDGTELTVEISATLNYDEHNNPLNVIGIARDITQRKREEKLKVVLINISKKIALTNTLAEFSHIVKLELTQLLNTDNFYIGLYNKENDTISVPFFADDLEYEFKGNDVFTATGSASGYVISTKKPLLASSNTINELIRKNQIKQLGPVSAVWLGVPLLKNNEALGVIAVQSYTNPNEFTASDQKILEIVAEQIVIAIQKIQSQQKINENEEKFRSIFELSPDMVNLLDLQGNIVDCNQELVKQLGYDTKTELLGKNYLKQFTGDQTTKIASVFDKLIKSGQMLNQEHSMIRKNGTTFPVEISAVLNYDEYNMPKNIIGIGRDITQRKIHEEEMTQALEKATQADRLKSAFLANMSHEIRTPMNGIIGFAEMLKDKQLTEEKRAIYANIIMNSSRQLLSIINDVLDMSTIEAGLAKMTYEPISINEMIIELHAFFSQKSEEKGIALSYDLPLENNHSVITTDATKVQQILTNLISNAIKFTQKGSVKVGYQLKDNFLEFYVTDTGKGIDKKYHKEVFERFRQVNQEYTKETIGNGLGLSICSRFIELLGGHIWLASEPGKGSTFFFTIPYQPAELLKNETITTQQYTVMNEQITILVAEDEEYNRIFIEEILNDQKITILTAENGVKAIEVAKNHPEIKFILMDIKMPIMNGIEASKHVREFNKTVPIVALTAFSMESDKNYLLSEGFDDYVAKPIVKKDLLRIISKFGAL